MKSASSRTFLFPVRTSSIFISGLYLLIYLLLSFELFAQALPENYRLNAYSGLKKNNSAGPLGNGITDIITIGDTVWLNTGKGLSRSTDRGLSWKNYYGTESFGEEDISAIAYYCGVIWAATSHDVDVPLVGVTTYGSGLKYSTDNGSTWNTVDQPVDGPGDSSVIYGINRIRAMPVTTKAYNVIWDIALSPGTVWIASWAGGIRKSTDMGKTWQRIVLPPDNLNSIKPADTLRFSLQTNSNTYFGNEANLNHIGYSVLAVDSLNIYAGTAGGINKSTNGGISWKKFNHTNQLKSISGNWVMTISYNPLSKMLCAGTLRAADNNEDNGLSYSLNDGESWSTALGGSKVRGIAFKNQDVIAATENGVYRSPNLGITWILPGNISDKHSGTSIKTEKFFAASCEENDIWLGSDAGLAMLQEQGGMWLGDWKVYLASQPLSSTSDTYAYPNPFSPDAEVLKIKYTTGGRQTRVSIRIFDFGMNLVRTIIQNADRGSTTVSTDPENGGVIDYWDGRDEQGRTVPNGVYFYRIDIDGSSPVFGKIIVLI